jgi:hypothetical protein
LRPFIEVATLFPLVHLPQLVYGRLGVVRDLSVWVIRSPACQQSRFDGFQVFLIRDIRKLRVEPYATFKATALKRRRDRRPVKPRLRLDDFRQVIRSAGRRFPLVTIHREQVEPRVCQIGAVVDVEGRRVVLREIRPDGTWMHRAAAYALREITRVDFGGAYEQALHVVGGRPPRANKTQQPTGAPSGARG